MANTSIKLDLKDKDRFSRQNYDVWAHRLKTIFQIEESWDIVNDTTAKPVAPPTQAEISGWEKKDLRSRAVLELSIQSSMMHHKDDAATLAEAWTTLSQMFATTNQSSLVHATRSFWNCKMKDHKSVEDHVMRFRHLRQKLASAGTKVTELQASVALLMSLPEKYRVFVSTQNGTLRSAAAGTVTLSSTIGALLEEEASMVSGNNTSFPTSSKVLFTSSRGGRGSRGGRFYPGQGRQYTQAPNFASSGSSSTGGFKRPPCGWCRIPGHSKNE